MVISDLLLINVIMPELYVLPTGFMVYAMNGTNQ